MNRSSTSRIGAQTPTCEYVGSRPISTVATPMSISVVTSIDLRPILSPKWPKTMPPTGRAKKPTAYVAKAAIVPASASKFGKNSLLNTSADAVPYRKKSYHSMVVPMKLAMTTRRVLLGSDMA